MFVVPAEIAVIVPFDTEAIAGSSEEYLTVIEDGVFFVTLTGVVSPTFRVAFVWFKVIVGFLTVTVAFKVLETFFPAFLAVTLTLFKQEIRLKDIAKSSQ